MLDLNGFKAINDTLGHDVGDQVLKAVAKRLQSSVRDSDTVARLSGDEFVLVLTNQPSLRFLTRMVDRVRSAMSKPVSYDSREGTVGAALGVSVFPHDGATPFELVRAADVAMYHSKEAGRNEAHFFSAEMKSSTEARRKLELNMRAALENDEIFLLFQPRVSMDTSKLTGIEALLRWRHPEQGVLPPSAFLAEAEENGMIVALGNRVLDLVCGFTLRLRELGYSALPVSMNASFREFSQKNYIEGVAARLGENKLSVGDVELELLEAQLVRDMRVGRQVVAELERWGVALTLDHFCENMSNLNFARELPLKSVKLARSAIAEIGTDGGLLARTVIELGHNLQARVIAEGVETEAEYDFLRAHGCDELQGNYYCEPLDQAALEVLLSQPGGEDRQWQPAQ
jgi:diguanylate cyclase (GGDEF)-like protein